MVQLLNVKFRVVAVVVEVDMDMAVIVIVCVVMEGRGKPAIMAALSTLRHLLSQKYPSTALSLFHSPIRFKLDIVIPASTASVALVFALLEVEEEVACFDRNKLKIFMIYCNGIVESVDKIENDNGVTFTSSVCLYVL
jgi:hypothetical protein